MQYRLNHTFLFLTNDNRIFTGRKETYMLTDTAVSVDEVVCMAE